MAAAEPGPPGPDEPGPPGPDEPITPHATPILDEQGRLTYVGDDGRRYVVGLSPELDEQSVERVMAALREGGELFQAIETLCWRWIQVVSRANTSELDARAALVLLLTTLETALEDGLDNGLDNDPEPPGP
jgi:hypothetical protein